MSGIFFYSILIFILLSIFVPSIYTYAYSCFIGRIVLVLLIIYFSKCSILLGLVFVGIIIVTSMPLYEGFGFNEPSEKPLAKNLLVTSNYSIKDDTNNQQVFDYFTKYYCAKDGNGNTAYPLTPNTEKYNRWLDIFKDKDSDNDSKEVAGANIILQESICNSDNSRYYNNYSNNISSAFNSNNGVNIGSVDGCSAKSIDENVFCSYWAAVGECSRNPGYMLYRCKASCNRMSGNNSSGTNHVYNFSRCLNDNFKSQVCNNTFFKNMFPSAKNVSNNADLDPYFQQDGQWLLNTYGQICN